MDGRQLVAQQQELAQHRIVTSGTGRIAFMVNQWKNQAENAYALGWTDSSQEEMFRMQRVWATADATKSIMPLLFQLAAAEKAGISSTSNLPPSIRGLGVAAAISVGSGSACVLYTKQEDFLRIDFLVANTQAKGQKTAQEALLQHVKDLAKQDGIKDLRLANTTLSALYISPGEAGFREVPGCPWLQLE